MIRWKKSGLMSEPAGEAARLGFAGIFTIGPPRKAVLYDRDKGSSVEEGGWTLTLRSREFSFAWDFPSKTRCLEYAESLVVAWGLEDQVIGTPEPNPADRHTAIEYREMRFRLGYGPNVAKEYVSA